MKQTPFFQAELLSDQPQLPQQHHKQQKDAFNIRFTLGRDQECDEVTFPSCFASISVGLCCPSQTPEPRLSFAPDVETALRSFPQQHGFGFDPNASLDLEQVQKVAPLP